MFLRIQPFFVENRLFQILFQGREDSFSTKVSVDDNAIRINHERSGDGAYVIVFSYFAVANTLQIGQVEPFYIVFLYIANPSISLIVHHEGDENYILIFQRFVSLTDERNLFLTPAAP